MKGGTKMKNLSINKSQIDNLTIESKLGNQNFLQDLWLVKNNIDSFLNNRHADTTAMSPATQTMLEIKLRKTRNQTFGSSIFKEPGWDIMLDLFINYIASKKISVSSACIASNVPPTTALRHISILEREGLIDKQRDPVDRRKIYTALTVKGLELMNKWACNIAN